MQAQHTAVSPWHGRTNSTYSMDSTPDFRGIVSAADGAAVRRHVPHCLLQRRAKLLARDARGLMCL